MQALNAALVQALVGSGQIHALEGWGITSPYPLPGWTSSPSCSRNHLPGGQAALKFRSFSVKWRVSELGAKMKETGLLPPKIVIKLHEWKPNPAGRSYVPSPVHWVGWLATTRALSLICFEWPPPSHGISNTSLGNLAWPNTSLCQDVSLGTSCSVKSPIPLHCVFFMPWCFLFLSAHAFCLIASQRTNPTYHPPMHLVLSPFPSSLPVLPWFSCWRIKTLGTAHTLKVHEAFRGYTKWMSLSAVPLVNHLCPAILYVMCVVCYPGYVFTHGTVLRHVLCLHSQVKGRDPSIKLAITVEQFVSCSPVSGQFLQAAKWKWLQGSPGATSPFISMRAVTSQTVMHEACHVPPRCDASGFSALLPLCGTLPWDTHHCWGWWLLYSVQQEAIHPRA